MRFESIINVIPCSPNQLKALAKRLHYDDLIASAYKLPSSDGWLHSVTMRVSCAEENGSCVVAKQLFFTAYTGSDQANKALCRALTRISKTKRGSNG